MKQEAKYVIGEYVWANQRHRIEWNDSLTSYIVTKWNETSQEWQIVTGQVPVNEVAVLLGHPRKR